ncbi:acyltransferase [Thermomonas alba]|uniref:acyltransferase n=1 Tax=Thermomonas alba TaxID=2888525 RepID=UPI001F03C100|nr:acyltransferase [Thermomonas alba]
MRNFDGIHPTVQIGDGVVLGEDIVIGPNTIIYDNVHIGSGSRIGANVILGEPCSGFYASSAGYENPVLMIGSGARIRAGSILYSGSTFGDGLETGHRVTIREGTSAGLNFRVGTLSDIQGDCYIGDYVRLHSNVHIGQKSKIGNFVWIFPYVVLTNDPHPPSNELVGVEVDDFAVIATMSVILPGIRIGQDALVGAGSIVNRNVEPESVVVGNPAKKVATVREIKSKKDGGAVYPWRHYFDRGMPWQGIGYDAWLANKE